MNRAARIYTAGLFLAAATLIVVLEPVENLALLWNEHAVGIFAFAAVALFAERLAIDFGTGKQARSSLAFLPFLACAVKFSPDVTILVVATVITTSNFLLRKQDFVKRVFNISQVIVSVGIASVAYQFVAAAGDSDMVRLVAFIVMSLLFFGCNILLTTFAISLIRGQRLLNVIVQAAGPRGSNLWYDLLASPIALIVSMLYTSYSTFGLVVTLLPLFLVRNIYISKLKLEESNRDLLKALVKAIETRDPYTSGHSLRVANLARQIATDLGLSNRRVTEIETAALLHDVGKIDAIYASIIRKPYDLNADERRLIRTHATKGADLLQSMSSVSSDIIRAVRHHHERYDGTGYPDGLRGDSIPVAARIIMLCDSIDAMLSDRPYRRALTVEHVREELARCSGTQFDPQLVHTMLSRNTIEAATRDTVQHVELEWIVAAAG